MAQLTSHEVIEAQRQDWNRVASGWEKWDRLFDQQMAYLNHRLVADAHLCQGQRVLDLGSGTGYPALLAAQTVGPTGSVVGIDLAEQMLVAAERKAKRLGLTNIVFRTGDVSTLPFDQHTFDAATSRFCLMFLPEIPMALAEIARVIKPGGYFAAAVWSTPDKNPYLNIPINVIKQFIELPPPDPTAPGIFRLARPGDLAGMLRQAGFADICEQEILADVRFPAAQDYVESLMEIAAPVQNLFAKLTAGQQEAARDGILQNAHRFQRNTAIVLPIAVRFVSAQTPV
ncbi:MAG TPA: methyltransferase domain-containing protein [Nitrospira sp.]|nr:methyltransferase domain-containing protein [Nitrospira sp.]